MRRDPPASERPGQLGRVREAKKAGRPHIIARRAAPSVVRAPHTASSVPGGPNNIVQPVTAESQAVARLRAQGVLLVEQGGRGGIADYTGCLSSALARRGVPVIVATADDHRFGALTGVQIDPVFHYLRDHSSAARVIRRLHASWVVNGLRFLMAIPKLTRVARRQAVVHVQGWERNSWA